MNRLIAVLLVLGLAAMLAMSGKAELTNKPTGPGVCLIEGGACNPVP